MNINESQNIEYLKIEIKIKDELKNNIFSEKEKNTESVAQSYSYQLVKEAIQLTLSFTDISYPGCIVTSYGCVLCDNSTYIRVSAKNGCFVDEYSSQWLYTTPVDFSDVFKWLSRTNYFRSPHPTNRIERTIASFTHAIALENDQYGEILFRSMQGLESFYCDGNGDLRKQLADKSALWLNSTTEFPFSIGKLYEIRSKVVHGSAGVDYLTHQLGKYEPENKNYTELMNASDFAFKLLLATLQKCINDNIIEINWTYSYTTE